MPSRISNLAGFTTSITSTTNLSVGVVTASSFIGNLTGTASTASFATTSFGLSGTPNLNVGVVTSTILNSTNLNVSGISSVGSAITMYGSSGIVSATKYYGDGSSLSGIDATRIVSEIGRAHV